MNSKDDKQKIFISYAKEDYAIAKRLYDDLSKKGLTPWIDREYILPGQNWKIEIYNAIKQSSYFLALTLNGGRTKLTV